ncbi:uncharacterized protein LOC129596626 [Paramacrobiotus metropolitanus]|uniref:uncharacterized protein LOC129596626 n=1 Tax=Paramacrobiotus metropolitanus TaxID=2943436 RepID=UPI002446197F|nr:uncharacterized protein LOC129596626 [Paramacrobiotus metropolitanus]
MHMYRYDVLAWNAVDVRLKNGQMQHGRVINVADGGLIIDFNCPGQREQFVKYKRIFQWTSSCDCLEEHGGGKPVSVLLRRPVDGAWIWYIGKDISIGDDNDSRMEVALVQAETPHGTVTELVPTRQVRAPQRNKRSEFERVKKTDFVIRRCVLSDAQLCAFHQLGPTLQCVREQAIARPARYHGLLGHTLYYLQNSWYTPLTPEEVDNDCNDARSEKDGGYSRLRSCWWMYRQWSVNTLSKTPEAGGSHQMDLPLPPELWVTVFQSLDSIERLRCRRVSPLWNSILTTEAHFPDVRLTGCNSYYDADWHVTVKNIFWMVSGALKCLNKRTKLVVISELDLCDGRELVALIAHLLKAHRLPLVFYRCDFQIERTPVVRIVHRLASLAWELALGGRLMLKDCRIVDDHLRILLSQHVFRFRSQVELERQLWGLLPNKLILGNPRQNGQVVMQWNAGCQQEKRNPVKITISFSGSAPFSVYL